MTIKIFQDKATYTGDASRPEPTTSRKLAQPIELRPTEEMRKAARRYVERRMKVERHRGGHTAAVRDGQNLDKIREDEYLGKLAELALLPVLGGEVDLRVYTNRQQCTGFGADLGNWQVKSVRKSRYESSWVFQKTDRNGRDVLSPEHGPIAFVEIRGPRMFLVAEGTYDDLRERNLMKPLRNPKYHNKLAVYASNL